MILSAHQPAYLPWLGVFHKVAISDVFVLLDNVQFEKNSFINRNKIKTHKGDIWLTIPVSTSGHFQKTISEMEISKNPKWRKKHLKSIEFNYKKAPFFSDYQEFFEEIYSKEWIKLFDLLYDTLEFLLNEIGLETKIYLQSELGFKRKKQELILEMCEYFNAEAFVFGVLGKNYADKNLFNKYEQKIYFQEYVSPDYPQLHGDYIPNLSIIDLLFNLGSEKALDVILKGNISKIELKRIIKY